MKHLVLTLAALGMAGSLAACSKKDATTEAAAPNASGSDMAMATDAKMAKGTGTVTAVSADSVTINHGPIPEANWPAMTMGFKTSPALATSVKVGDKVAFDLKLQGGASEITTIQKE